MFQQECVVDCKFLEGGAISCFLSLVVFLLPHPHTAECSGTIGVQKAFMYLLVVTI
jgi:hypothetical protein